MEIKAIQVSFGSEGKLWTNYNNKYFNVAIYLSLHPGEYPSSGFSLFFCLQDHLTG